MLVFARLLGKECGEEKLSPMLVRGDNPLQELGLCWQTGGCQSDVPGLVSDLSAGLVGVALG